MPVARKPTTAAATCAGQRLRRNSASQSRFSAKCIVIENAVMAVIRNCDDVRSRTSATTEVEWDSGHNLRVTEYKDPAAMTPSIGDESAGSMKTPTSARKAAWIGR